MALASGYFIGFNIGFVAGVTVMLLLGLFIIGRKKK